MSNVLPPDAAKDVWGMYRARSIILGSLIAVGVAALAALALLPSYLALRIDDANAAAATSSQNVSSQADRDAIARTKSILALLSPYATATTTATAAISRALSARPSGIAIDHISYASSDSKEAGTLILVGSALRRESINAYRSALSRDTLFKSVSVPIGDLASPTGGRFSVTIKGGF